MLSGGSVVAERFVIEQHVATGGMGAIYRALDRQSGARVAVKVLIGDQLDANDKQRFWREAQLLSELSHPAIVRYVGHGLTDLGAPFLAMEWLDGIDLAERLGAGPLTRTESMELARSLAEALSLAHERGIVHRDVKPENVHLGGGSVERAKLLDFGIARVKKTTRSRTRTGLVLGTPGYMAPEQARGSGDVGPPADVYALGCVIFECLTGAPIFTGETPLALLGKVLMEEPPRLRASDPSAPLELDDLLARMLAKSPAERPPHGAAVGAELAALMHPSPRRMAASYPWTASITAGEQRLVCILAAAPEAGDDDMDATVTPQQLAQRADLLQRRVSTFGARLELTTDGSVLAVLRGGGSATDQAARAARCALALRGLLRNAPMVLATGRAVLGAAMPVGEVLDRAVQLLTACCEAVTDEPTVDEDDVRTTLQYGSTPRPIRIDSVTAGLLDARFEVVDQQGLVLLGEREIAGDRGHTLLGVTTSLVGRERELGALMGLCDECVSEPVARPVLLLGEAGLGKSRLKRELLQRLHERGSNIEIWQARGDELRAGAPFLLVAQLLRRACNLREGEPIDRQRASLQARVARSVDPAAGPRLCEFLGEMIGARFGDEASATLRAARADAQLMADRMKAAWVELLAAECRQHPVLLVLEDLQWGDRVSVKLVGAALRVLGEQPLCVLALARPEAGEVFPDLWAGHGVQTVRLGPLTRRAAERIARQALPDALPETVERVCAQAQGNALYLEELIRAVSAGAGDVLPDTVLAMVQARLEALEPELRRLLRAASVLGDRFWPGGLVALLGKSAAADLDKRLRELCERELVMQQPDSELATEPEYAFCHPLARAAAYAMLTDDDRALAHRLAAAWLKRVGMSEPVVVAEHHHRGGEREPAARWYLEAAYQALAGSDLEVALARAKRASECGACGGDLGRLRLLEAEAHHERGDLAVAEGCAEGALELLQPGSTAWCHAAGELAEISGCLGRRAAVAGVAAMLLAQDDADPSALLVAVARTTQQLVNLGAHEEARTLLDCLGRLEKTLDADALRAGWLARARAFWAGFVENDMARYLSLSARSADSFREAGHVRMQCRQRTNLGVGYWLHGAHAQAEAHLRSALADAESMGLVALVAGIRANLAVVLAARGDPAAARPIVLSAIEMFAEQNNPRSLGMSYVYLATIEALSGDFAASEGAARKALDVATQLPTVRVHALAVLAWALLEQRRAADAVAVARDSMELFRSVGLVDEGEALLRLVHAEAEHAAGSHDDAKRAIVEARARLRERAEWIRDPALRKSFLCDVRENARTLELADRWLDGG